MAYSFTANWTSGYAIGSADSTAIQADLQTRGDNYDFGHYGAPNMSFLTLVPGDTPANSYTVTAASWTGGTVTLTVSAAHNIQVGQHFSVSSVTSGGPGSYNSTDAVAVSGTTGTTIKYAVGTNPGTYSSGGTVLVDRLATQANGMLSVDVGYNLRLFDGTTTQVAGAAQRAVMASAPSNIANTTSETPFGKHFSIPANSLQVGQIIHVRVFGIYTTTGTPNLTVQIRLGGTGTNGTSVLAQIISTPNNTSGTEYWMDMDLAVISLGSSGVIIPLTQLAYSNNSFAENNQGYLTIDTTSALPVFVTATWSAASASNSVGMLAYAVEVLSAATIL